MRSIQLLILRLQDYEGDLNFCIDAWTSPNHHAFVAITVHYKESGKAQTYLLDIVEVAESHTGVVLATAFTQVLEVFRISDKVRLTSYYMRKSLINFSCYRLHAITPPLMMPWSKSLRKAW